MDSKSKYVDMMTYVLFVKGVIEVACNVYNSGLFNTEWPEKNIDTTYNAGLWNSNWHNYDEDTKDDDETINKQDDTKTENTYDVANTKTHIRFLHLDGIDGHTEDTTQNNKYSSPQEETLIMSAVNTDDINGRGGNSNVLNELTPVYNKDDDDIVIVPEISYPWFNSSKRGIVKMNLDHSLHTFKPFNNASLDTVKAYDDDKLDIIDTSTPNVSLYGKIDTIDEYLYKKCADEITNRNNQHKSVEFKFIPDHFKDIMSSNHKSEFTHKSSEYTNKKMIQTVNFIKTCQ